MSVRALLRASWLTLALLPSLLLGGALPASADDRPRPTVLRLADPPPAAPDRELVIVVGGLGSDPADSGWDPLVARLRAEGRYEVRRFGAEPGYPYDSYGPLDGSARELAAQVRALAPRYAGVHLVGHSMGGAVIDRALAQGLGAGDGVRTYVALASPHQGATAAQIAATTLALAGDESIELRAALPIPHDLASPAIQDLARIRT
ncbi:MAG: esterase/lipase family protein, partial [Candidatus Limnocylindria bacterium]